MCKSVEWIKLHFKCFCCFQFFFFLVFEGETNITRNQLNRWNKKRKINNKHTADICVVCVLHETSIKWFKKKVQLNIVVRQTHSLESDEKT